MSVVAVIPARYASTRLPAKPLLRETGKFLIQHVYERVRQTRGLNRCVVATDDERIAAAVRSFGGEVLMTRADHPTGTDRIAEVARLLQLRADDLILNVQGDEPEIEPAYLERLIDRMQEGSTAFQAVSGDSDRGQTAASVLWSEGTGWKPVRPAGVQPPEVLPTPTPSPRMGTLAAPFPANLDPSDPNCVKVVCDEAGRALYFSRGLIPYPRDGRAGAAQPWLLHVGVYAYRAEFLQTFAGWSPTRLEQVEKLEQLRALEHGAVIAVVRVERTLAGIDTPEDYARFVARVSGG